MRYPVAHMRWQVVRYDCGHSLRAEVSAPLLPSTKELVNSFMTYCFHGKWNSWKDYGTHETDRSRYVQHCLHVRGFALVFNPDKLMSLKSLQRSSLGILLKRRPDCACCHAASHNACCSKVQITVPEGRCRHCQRGQRQTLASEHEHLYQ